jgi:hypothetical protein
MILPPTLTNQSFLYYSDILINNPLACRFFIILTNVSPKKKRKKMEPPRRTASQKRLAPNQRVSGAVGEFIEGGPTKCRR